MKEAGVKRGAGRPRAFDRAAALEIAMDVFWRNGYEGTSTAQLTQAMGIAPPSLYAAFGSKEALYREAIKLYEVRHGGYFGAALAAPTSAREAMRAVLLGAARQFTGSGHAPGCMVATANIQCASELQGLSGELCKVRLTAQQALHRRLDLACEQGELARGCDTAALASFFALMIQGMAVQAHDGATLGTLERVAELAMGAWPDPAG
jgi:AcrR family transcriptional regulator